MWLDRIKPTEKVGKSIWLWYFLPKPGSSARFTAYAKESQDRKTGGKTRIGGNAAGATAAMEG
jgi:hypothetical protein